MNQRKYYYFTLSFLMFIINNTTAQDKIDSFLNTLHNKDVRSTLSLVAPKRTFDSGRIYAHTVERVLTSINIGQIRKTYPKYLMVSRLVQSLDDPERDWYADLLLYNLNLTRILSLNVVSCDTREKWLRPKPKDNITYKEADVQMWRNYLAGLTPSDKW
jgi:hypothetical protein